MVKQRNSTRLKNQNKAQQMLQRAMHHPISKLGDHMYSVMGEHGKAYKIIASKLTKSATCQCKHFEHRCAAAKKHCKHIQYFYLSMEPTR